VSAAASLRCRHCQRRRLLHGQSAEAGETYMRRTCQHGTGRGAGCDVVIDEVTPAVRRQARRKGRAA